MAINAYAERLLNNHEVGSRTSVPRREVMLSFKATSIRGETIFLMDHDDYLAPLLDGCSGDQKMYDFIMTREVANVMLVNITVASVVTAVISVIVTISLCSQYFLNLGCFLSALMVPSSIVSATLLLPMAIRSVTQTRQEKYLNEKLDRKKLEAYLTEVKARADYIGQSDRVCQGKARYAREISRQLSAGELTELAK